MDEVADSDEPSAPAPMRPDLFTLVLAHKPKSIQSGSKEAYKQMIRTEARSRFTGPMLPGYLYARILWFHGTVTNSRDGDVDNISKPILDALKGIAFADDAQVKMRLVYKICTMERYELDPDRADRGALAELTRLLDDAREHIIYVEVGRLTSDGQQAPHRVSFGPIDEGNIG